MSSTKPAFGTQPIRFQDFSNGPILEPDMGHVTPPILATFKGSDPSGLGSSAANMGTRLGRRDLDMKKRLVGNDVTGLDMMSGNQK